MAWLVLLMLSLKRQLPSLVRQVCKKHCFAQHTVQAEHTPEELRTRKQKQKKNSCLSTHTFDLCPHRCPVCVLLLLSPRDDLSSFSQLIYRNTPARGS